jgi:hypothetical protein
MQAIWWRNLTAKRSKYNAKMDGPEGTWVVVNNAHTCHVWWDAVPEHPRGWFRRPD